MKLYLIKTHSTDVMIFADSRARWECLTPLDYNGVLVVMNSAGHDASRREFPLLALFRNKYAFGVCFLVLRLPRFLIQFFILLLYYTIKISLLEIHSKKFYIKIKKIVTKFRIDLLKEIERDIQT